MSQFDSDAFVDTESGTQLISRLNSSFAAHQTTHKGSSAPSYAVAGMDWIDDTATPWVKKVYDGTDWIITGEINATTNAFTVPQSVTDTITAGSTQTQAGATALTASINRVTVSGTDGDGVKLPTAAAGSEILVINSDSAQTIQVWPNTSDAINGGSANAVDGAAIPAGGSRRYIAADATNWYSVGFGAPSAFRFRSASTADNVTGNGTQVDPVVFGTKEFDIGGDFSSNIFTAPVAGKYLFSTTVRMLDLVSASLFTLRITGTGAILLVSHASPPDGQFALTLTGLISMAAADTAKVELTVTGMAGNTADIDAGSQTSFSGHRVA